MKPYLLTLHDTIIGYQGRKRLQIADRNDRNKFNAFRFLSSLLGYKDDSTIYKMINQSTSRVKMGVDDLEGICIEALDSRPIEDLLIHVNEKIAERKKAIKRQVETQLSLY